MGAVIPSLRAACGAVVGALVLTVSLASAIAGGSQLVSVRNPAVPLVVPGNGSSAGPIVSADGRYVVFNSTASDLVPNDNGLLYTDVFVRDRQSNITTLVSVNMFGTGGGNGSSIADDISADSRYILFESEASDLVAGGSTNVINNIYVRDLVLGTTVLVSVSTNGVPGSGASTKPFMSPDGRFITFVSTATNLIAHDTNGIADVFVRDLLAGTTTLVSVGATFYLNGTAMDTPVITADGRFVAFVSNTRGMVPFFNSSHSSEIYLHDLLAGTTVWVSTNFASQNQMLALHPSISDDGRFITYKQSFGSIPGSAYVYRYDSIAESNFLITNGFFNAIGVTAPSYNDDVYGPEITPDGRFVFISFVGILRWDGQTSNTIQAVLDASGVAPTNTSSSVAPVFTADGRYLTFLCNATNMVTNSVSNGFHLYLRDLQIGTNYLVDVDTNGVGSTDLVGTVQSMSADGRYIAFAALDGNLVPSDNNLSLDVFLRDMTNGTTELISRRYTGATNQTGAGISSISQASITPDGHWLVFSSRADDLVTNDFNNDQDVFVRDLWTGSNTLVSVGTNGVTPLGGYSGSPAITPDGRYVVFNSAATNLFSNDVNRAADLFVRDLQTGTTTLVFTNNIGGGLGSGDASSPSISADGRYISFFCRTNTTTSVPMWLDTLSNNLVVLTNVNTAIAPSMSTNGRYIAFVNSSSNLFVRDMQTSLNIYTNAAVANTMALSPGGNRLLFTIVQAGVPQTFVADIAGASNLFTQNRTQRIVSQAQWSADDRYFAFVASTNLTAGDSNNTNDVYLCDLQTGTVTLVSLNASHSGAGNGASDSPAVSGSGRFVVFRSLATDIVPGVTNSPNIYMFDRFTGSNTAITTEASPAISWSSWLSKPALNSDGSVVAFQSLKPNHVSGVVDLNRVQDVFSQAPTLLSFLDSDTDGIPDWWLMQYFGHTNGQAGDLSRAQDDADGDGMSNLQEYLTGTVPTSGSSVFRLQLTPVVASTNVTLAWPSIPGKSYRVQYKDHADDAAWLDQPGNIYVGGSQVSFVVPAIVSNRFYRVVAVN